MVSPRRRRKATHLNESGQAVIEYVLVLCVTVMLIGSLLYRFSTAFRTYANNFFGDYVACLHETGELPGNASCSAEFKAFNLADGKTSSGGTGGGDGSGGGGSGSSGNSGSGSGGKKGAGGKSGGTGKSGSSKDGSGDGSNSDSSSGSGGGETVGQSGSASGGSGLGKRSSTRLGSSSKVAGGAGKDAGGKGRAGLTAIASVSNSSSSGGNGSGRRTALSRGFQYYGQEEDQEKAESRAPTTAVAKDESGSLKPKKVAEPPPRAPASKYDGDQGGFSLGGLIRILLIAGIVVAIFILFGGQILAISKSGEK